MAFRDYVLKNFGWKVISLLLAALIWYNIHSSHPNEIQLSHNPVSSGAIREFPSLPITVLTDAADLHGYLVRPNFVKVIVTGNLALLKNLTAKDIQVFVNLTDLTESSETMQKINVFPPGGVTLVGVTPPFVRVERIKPRDPNQTIDR